jgi:hypothetical protein
MCAIKHFSKLLSQKIGEEKTPRLKNLTPKTIRDNLFICVCVIIKEIADDYLKRNIMKSFSRGGGGAVRGVSLFLSRLF